MQSIKSSLTFSFPPLAFRSAAKLPALAAPCLTHNWKFRFETNNAGADITELLTKPRAARSYKVVLTDAADCVTQPHIWAAFSVHLRRGVRKKWSVPVIRISWLSCYVSNPNCRALESYALLV